MIDVGLFLAYILIGVCVLAAVGMPLMKVAGDPESMKKMGIGVGALLVVFLVSFFTASGEATGDETATTVKLVGAGLTTFYILAIGAIAGIVYTEIKKATE
ncbi:MAG: hypothetical protein Tsb0034_14920 [Ekhidna sp.]